MYGHRQDGSFELKNTTQIMQKFPFFHLVQFIIICNSYSSLSQTSFPSSWCHHKPWVPKGASMALGLKAGLQDRKNRGSRSQLPHSRAPFCQNQHFCDGSMRRKAWAPGSMAKIIFGTPGLQSPPPTPPFGTLNNVFFTL